ncbi:MAG: glycosyltransferase [Candidatus Adlerbacteria bacterium]|nr:glycosyltransferase [Candidatus Adlerbacteria bacterium]
MITGDRQFKPGNPRFELQKSAVGELTVVYWGPGALIPRIPWKRFDVITAQDPFWRGHLAWHLSWFLAPRLNIQVHTDLSSYPVWKRLFARLQLGRADSVRVVSEKIKQQVHDMVPNAAVSVLPVFIDISKFQSAVRTPHTGKYILWIGRFEEEKNPLEAIAVFREVLKGEPSAKLVMLGRGSLQKILVEHAAGLPVDFPGWHDPVTYLETADVVLCTSWHESFGASIIEALAAGVPVVAPDVGAAREAGATVVPRNELSTAIGTALKYGAAGRLLMHMPTAEEWTNRWLQTL